MDVLLHSPAEGKQPGETVTVSKARGDWLVAEGYASNPKDDADHVADTTVKFKDLPTEAENFKDEELEKQADKAAKAENAPEVGKGEPVHEIADSQLELMRQRQDDPKVKLLDTKPAGTSDNVPANPPIDDIEQEILDAKQSTEAPEPTTADDLNLQAAPPSEDDLEKPAEAPSIEVSRGPEKTSE